MRTCRPLVLVASMLFFSGCDQAREAQPGRSRTAQQASQSPQEEAEAFLRKTRQPTAPKEELSLIRVIAHPSNPMVLYVTGLPEPPGAGLVGRVLWTPGKPAVAKVFVVDVKSGTWQEVNLAQHIEKQFGMKDLALSFEVGNPSRVSVER